MCWICVKTGDKSKHGGGRKRITFCESCSINPVNSKFCSGCKKIHNKKHKEANRELFLLRRREIYQKNKVKQLAQKKKWKLDNLESVLKAELARKDRLRYGEMASAHRAFINIKKLIKEMS